MRAPPAGSVCSWCGHAAWPGCQRLSPTGVGVMEGIGGAARARPGVLGGIGGVVGLWGPPGGERGRSDAQGQAGTSPRDVCWVWVCEEAASLGTTAPLPTPGSHAPCWAPSNSQSSLQSFGEVGSRNPSALLVASRRRTAIRSKRSVSWGRSLPPVAARCASLLHYSRSDCWGWRQAPAPTGRVPWAGRTGPKCPAVVARRAWSERNQPPAPQPLPKVPARSAQRLPSGRLCMRFCILPERLRPSGQRPVLTGRAGLLPHVRSVRLVCFSALVRRANARQRGATAP